MQLTDLISGEQPLLPWVALSILGHLVVGAFLGIQTSALRTEPPPLEVAWISMDAPKEIQPTPPPAATPPPEPRRRVATAPAPRPSLEALPEPAPSSASVSPQHTAPPKVSPIEANPAGASAANKETLMAAIKAPRATHTHPMMRTPSVNITLPNGANALTSIGQVPSGSRLEPGLGQGHALRPIPEVEAEIKEDGRRIVARNRTARGLVSKETHQLGDALEAHWEITARDVRSWPTRSEIRMEYFAPEGLEDAAGVQPCQYRRRTLARVKLTVDEAGSLVDLEFITSSHSRRLDREVEDLVRRSAPFPPPNPDDLDANGHARSVWDIGAKDYGGLSTCIHLGGSRIVKDIELIESYSGVRGEG